MDAITYYSRNGAPLSYLNWMNKVGCETTDLIVNLLNKESFPPFSNGLLVDLGAGPGTSFRPIAKTLNLKNVFLVDAVSEMISLAKENSLNEGFSIQTKVANLIDTKVNIGDETADFVLSSLLFMYLESLKNVLSETARILKKGGYFGCSVVHYLSKEINGPLPFFDPEGIQCYAHGITDFAQTLNEAGFDYIGIEKVSDYPLEGTHGIILVALFKKIR